MKNIIFIFLVLFLNPAFSFQMQSQKELGKADAKNQNVIVQCTTASGKISNETCTIRRFAKCNSKGDCSGWQDWIDIKNPTLTYKDWRSAASACCLAKGQR